MTNYANEAAHANVDVRLGALDWIFSGPMLAASTTAWTADFTVDYDGRVGCAAAGAPR